MSGHSIRSMEPRDWPQVRRIYEEGIATGKATFDTEVPDWAEWDAGHLREARLVAEGAGKVLGWAALMPASSRACYRGVAEVSVYVAEAARGQGVGGGLLAALIPESEAAGIWTLFASTHADNAPSRAVHERAGFRVIGRRERIAQRNGGWTDTIVLERRSRVAGV